MIPQCGFCGRETSDVVYVGRVRGCGVRVAFGRCCKERILQQFKTIGDAARAFAKLHTIACSGRRERASQDVMVDLSGEGEFGKNPMAN